MTTEDGGGGPEKRQERLPIGFLLVLVVTALYLGWRVLQGAGWLLERLSG
jgi:hypothetical protein